MGPAHVDAGLFLIAYLNGVRGSLPEGVNPVMGLDATGVGWVSEYALVDDTGQPDLTQLRSFRDWNLRYVLESVTLREKRINESIEVALGCLLFL